MGMKSTMDVVSVDGISENIILPTEGDPTRSQGPIKDAPNSGKNDIFPFSVSLGSEKGE
jgi:hypothetical protein